jgi:hypothetical protein
MLLIKHSKEGSNTLSSKQKTQDDHNNLQKYKNEAVYRFLKCAETKKHISNFVKEVSASYTESYKGYSTSFVPFLKLMQTIALTDFPEFQNVVLEQCKFISLLNSIMLDSDNLLSDQNKTDKI